MNKSSESGLSPKKTKLLLGAICLLAVLSHLPLLLGTFINYLTEKAVESAA